MKEFITKNSKETGRLAQVLAKELSRKAPKDGALVIGLEGELGAGKTTFIKAFAKGLGIKEKVLSPTFVLMKIYKIKSSNYQFLIHIDAYRLKDHRDLLPLGIKDILNDPKNIVLIEWSDRVEKVLPKKYVKIHFDHVDGNTRKITIWNSPPSLKLRKGTSSLNKEEMPALRSSEGAKK